MRSARLFVSVLISLGLAAGCERPVSRSGEEPSTGPPRRVQSMRVGGLGDEWIEVPGTVEAAQIARLASRISASVERVAVEEGDRVRAGDLLVQLDGRDIRARLQAAEANLRAAEAQKARIADLYAKNAATEQEQDGAEANAAAARAERDAVRAQLQYVGIKSPFDGWVTAKNTQPGDLAVPGQPLLTVQGTGLMRLSATVTKEQAETLRVGERVEAVRENGSVLEARVAVLSPAGDPASLRFLVKADLPADAGVPAGSFMRLRLPAVAMDAMVTVPAVAIFERGALTGVYVVEEGRARLRWISPGERLGDAVRVRAGVSPGEEVILEPQGLSDGILVAATPTAAAEQRQP